MDTIKIVHLTNEQYEELLTNGQVEINGEIKYYDENTTYVCPSSESWAELNNKIDELILKKQVINPNYFHWETIEDEANGLLEENNEYTSDGTKLSFVAIRGYLKKGATINAKPSNVNENGFGNVYLNGNKLTDDYTYNEDGVEFVSVVIFDKADNTGFKVLENEFKFEVITDLVIYNHYNNPIVPSKYELLCRNFTSYNYSLNTIIASAENIKMLGSNAQLKTSDVFPYAHNIVIETENVSHSSLSSYALRTPTNGGSLYVDASKVKYWRAPERGNYLLKPDINIVFKDLLKVVANYQGAAFDGAKKLEFPETLESINGHVGTNYSALTNIETIILHCRNATFNDVWCNGTKTKNLILADNWNASLNCSTFTSLPLDKFRDILLNKLATTSEPKIFTVPTAIYNSLLPEEITEVINKGWTLAFA